MYELGRGRGLYVYFSQETLLCRCSLCIHTNIQVFNTLFYITCLIYLGLKIYFCIHFCCCFLYGVIINNFIYSFDKSFNGVRRRSKSERDEKILVMVAKQLQLISMESEEEQQQKRKVIKGDSKGKSPLCKLLICVFVLTTITTITTTFNKLWGFFGCLHTYFYLQKQKHTKPHKERKHITHSCKKQLLQRLQHYTRKPLHCLLHYIAEKYIFTHM